MSRHCCCCYLALGCHSYLAGACGRGHWAADDAGLSEAPDIVAHAITEGFGVARCELWACLAAWPHLCTGNWQGLNSDYLAHY